MYIRSDALIRNNISADMPAVGNIRLFVTIAALGKPVVPEVKINNATSPIVKLSTMLGLPASMDLLFGSNVTAQLGGGLFSLLSPMVSLTKR